MIVLTVSLLISSYVMSSSGQCLTGNDSPMMTRPDSTKMTAARSDFALEALKLTNAIEPDDNIFFSPRSIHQAVTLAYFGARGNTESSLKKALKIPTEFTKNDVERSYTYEKLKRKMQETKNASSSYEYKSANRLWISSAKKVRECMLDFFGDELEKIDFAADTEGARMKINDWVSNTTKGQIKDLIPAGRLQGDADLVLANAVYFKGLWSSKFDPANSKRSIFYGTTSSLVTFMRQKGTFNHAISEELGAHILQLPYKGDEVSMFILLPPFAKSRSFDDSEVPSNTTVNRDGIHQLIERITSTEKGRNEFREILDDGMPAREVEVSIPRFSIERELQLPALLHALGAGDIVSADTADLRGFLEEGEKSLHLGDAVHRAKIDINEEGTTAAAATAIFSFRSSRPAEPAIFNANYPFLYVIYDNANHEMIFAGIYRTPPATNSNPATS